MSKFLSSRHAGLNEYVPGEQPSDMQYIKLNTNESPYPPSPGVLSALSEAEISKLNLYPNPDGTRLIEKLAETYGVGPENVVIGNGSDELLAFAFMAFCDPVGVCFPNITYGFYPVYAQLFGVSYRQIPLAEDFTVRVEDYIGVNRHVILANPNAPTGIALTLADIRRIAESNPDNVVLIDEAYVDFGAESAIALVREHENLLVMHTYSKARSMAGARLAYAIAQKTLIEDLNKMKYSFNPYNVNRLTQLAGHAALCDAEYYTANCRNIIRTREYTEQKLQDLGFELTDSKANFVFAKKPGFSGRELYLALKQKGILVRQFNDGRISDYLRISIGTREQMDACITAIESIVGDDGNRPEY
ncbi:MAG: histidinol-phosphate transaminase [Oscillospiraceae bacterium]|nr:histidinol-phosphate transaminase [Oscillospiraceae bacterium]